VPFDKLSRRKVSRLSIYGQPCQATRSRPLNGRHAAWKAGCRAELMPLWVSGQKAKVGSGDGAVLVVFMGFTEILNPGREDLQNRPEKQLLVQFL